MEFTLRALIQDSLANFLRDKVVFWKQRSKIRRIQAFDENTKFFHAHASHKFRKNSIRSLLVDGCQVFDHDFKAAALFNYFSSTLGVSKQRRWNFSLHDLYPTSEGLFNSVWQDISGPFTIQEAKAAVDSMNFNSAPGPDGFGPSFYRTSWQQIQPSIQRLLQEFFDHTAQLERLNRAYIVLIHKPGKLNTPDCYRPISLQNCHIKILAKILATRLQTVLDRLIDWEQTGFMKGRSISKTFLYATELLQCCQKRKTPTAIIKLDFAKAFDSVQWPSLQAILIARNFPVSWQRWVSDILSTSKSAVLLNGIPGKWINCKQGLRQGDPLSPYLFILVANVLQKLIKKCGLIKHPLVAYSPVATLQYADDTLIICQDDPAQLLLLKSLLDDFAAATGLSINFSKSTLVTLHTSGEDSQAMANILQCKLDGFP